MLLTWKLETSQLDRVKLINLKPSPCINEFGRVKAKFRESCVSNAIMSQI